MSRLTYGVRRAVVREDAEHYLLLTLLSFAGSVSLTRLFLSLTGYPQIGGGGLHIAHVLWGGLLLFVAALVMLLLANRWAQTVGALITGIGVGLFIDEVGKFITQSNDYFYPLAAPIIYAFFLLIVLLYLRVRRTQPRDARDQMYYALESLGEVLDHDMEAEERTALEAQLHFVAEQSDRTDLAPLATALLTYVQSGSLDVTPTHLSLWQRWNRGLQAQAIRWIRPRRLKAVLVTGMTVTGLLTLTELVAFVGAALHPGFRAALLSAMASQSRAVSAGSPAWLVARMALEGLVGLLLLLAALLLAFGREERGVQLGRIGLLFALTLVNLLLFYFDQFATIVTAVVQLVLLLGVSYYRSSVLAERAATRHKQLPGNA
jgi:hypothetical protein